MWSANPTSGKRRIQAELAKLGISTGVMKANGKHHVAVNLLEQRANDGANRNLDVALIRGAHIWRSKFYGSRQRDVVNRRVPLVINKGKRTIFRGTVEVVLKLKQLEFRGKMD